MSVLWFPPIGVAAGYLTRQFVKGRGIGLVADPAVGVIRHGRPQVA
jgi:hypothetical protein